VETKRTLKGVWQRLFVVLTAAGVLLAIYQVFNIQHYTDVVFMENTYLYMLLGIFVSFSYIITPATKSAPRDRVPWYDAVLFLLILGVSGYFAWHGMDIIVKGWEFNAPPEATILAIVFWALLLEGGRRAGGLAIFLFALVASLYPIFAGHMPWLFAGYSLSILDTARYHIMSVESIIGIPMRVLGTLFIGFIIMGIVLSITGGGRFFIDIALAMCGSFRGGPAKVAVVASGLFGMMSGSAVSNVMATGGITIPLMKEVGYKPHYSGAVVTCSAVGGVLMPPIMGAVAFVMASMLGIPYVQIAIAAAVPSLLYYFGLFMHIDSYAARLGMRGIARNNLPAILETLKKGWFYIAALVVLVWLLVYLRQESRAPFYATALLLIAANIRQETRMNRAGILALVQSIGKGLVELSGILGVVGVVIGSLTVTGMAATFSTDLVRIAGENVYILLVMGALASLILGLGLTVTACYIFLAITLVPALVSQGINPLAANLFVLYWGVLSDITPPVCLSAFIAASIAGAGPMRTGFEAMRLGGVLYLLPFYFVLNPVLVLQNPTPATFLIAFSTALAGIIFIVAGLDGHLAGVGTLGSSPAGWLARLALIIGGVLVGFPWVTVKIAAVVLVVPVILSYLYVNRRMARRIPDTTPS